MAGGAAAARGTGEPIPDGVHRHQIGGSASGILSVGTKRIHQGG